MNLSRAAARNIGSLTEEAPTVECQSFFRSSKGRDDDGRETITTT
jgi:hypothetical protein